MVELGLVHLFKIEIHDTELIINNDFLVTVIEIPSILDSLFENSDAELVVMLSEGTLHQT